MFLIGSRSVLLSGIVHFGAPTSFQTDLGRITTLQEKFPPWVSTSFKNAGKNVHKKMRKTLQHLFYHGTVPLQLQHF